MENELLFNYGIAGVMLFWFMFRFESLIKNNTQAINNMTIQIRGCKYNK